MILLTIETTPGKRRILRKVPGGFTAALVYLRDLPVETFELLKGFRPELETSMAPLEQATRPRTASPAWNQHEAMRQMMRVLPFTACAHCGTKSHLFVPLDESKQRQLGWWRWCYMCGAKDLDTIKKAGLDISDAPPAKQARILKLDFSQLSMEKLDQLGLEITPELRAWLEMKIKEARSKR